MGKEEKKEMLKKLKQFVKGVVFFVVVGALIMGGLMNEDQRRGFMGDTHGFWA